MADHQLLIRQWTMLRLIPRSPRMISARQLVDALLSEGFQVTKRTIERDLVSLSTSFPILSDERNKPYGWSWSADAPQFNLPGLSISEAISMKLSEDYLARVLPTHVTASLKPHFLAAEKTLQQINTSNNLGKWPNKVAVIYPGQPLESPKIDEQIIPVIEEGLIQCKQITISYTNANQILEGEKSKLTVHPLGLVLRGKITYLIATVFNYQDIRMLALHRIKDASITDFAAVIPAEFNLQNYANSHATGFSNYGSIELALKINTQYLQYLIETPLSKDQKLTEVDDSHALIRAKVDDTDQLRWWLLGLGQHIEVIEPITLREWISNQLKAILDKYN